MFLRKTAAPVLFLSPSKDEDVCIVKEVEGGLAGAWNSTCDEPLTSIFCKGLSGILPSQSVYRCLRFSERRGVRAGSKDFRSCGFPPKHVSVLTEVHQDQALRPDHPCKRRVGIQPGVGADLDCHPAFSFLPDLHVKGSLLWKSVCDS